MHSISVPGFRESTITIQPSTGYAPDLAASWSISLPGTVCFRSFSLRRPLQIPYLLAPPEFTLHPGFLCMQYLKHN
jgi:hypothetical protein